jgi:hypothetical protein
MNQTVLTARASFYLDDEVLDTDLLVDPFEMPPFEVAQRLVNAYLESAQKSYPFLEKKALVNRLRHCKLPSSVSLQSTELRGSRSQKQTRS